MTRMAIWHVPLDAPDIEKMVLGSKCQVCGKLEQLMRHVWFDLDEEKGLPINEPDFVICQSCFEKHCLQSSGEI